MPASSSSAQAIYGVLYAVTRQHDALVDLVPANLEQIGDVIFRQPLRYDTPWPVSLLMIVGADRRVGRRSSSAACAASRWSRERADVAAPVAARRSSPPSTCRSGTARSSA